MKRIPRLVPILGSLPRLLTWILCILCWLAGLRAPQAFALELVWASGYELQGHGFYWWKFRPGPDIGYADTVEVSVMDNAGGLRRQLAANPALPDFGFQPAGELRAYQGHGFNGFNGFNIQENIKLTIIGGRNRSLVRDGSWIYYVDPFGKLARKALSAPAAEYGELLHFQGGAEVPANAVYMVRDGKVWFSRLHEMYSMNITEAGIVSETLILRAPANHVITEFTAVADRYFTLTDRGRLSYDWPVEMELFVGQTNTRVIGNDVQAGHWAIRMELTGNDAVRRPVVYCLNSQSVGGLPGQLQPNKTVVSAKRYDTVRGFTASPLDQLLTQGVTGFTMDKNNMYVASRTISGGIISRVGWGENQQNPASAWVTLQIPAMDAPTQMRTDEIYLYWLDRGKLHLADANAPAAVCDVAATAMEVVQVTQDLNNSIPLVTGRKAWARAYATTVVATPPYDNGNLFPDARLVVIRNGQAQAYLTPLETPACVKNADLATQRGNVKKGYLFEIPASQVLPNTTYQFQLNPRGGSPESPGASVANNISNVTPPTVSKVPTKLNFRMLDCLQGIYDPRGNSRLTSDILSRATSLMPVKEIQWGQYAGAMRKPVVKFCEVDLGLFDLPYPCLTDEAFDIPKDMKWALLWTTADGLFDIDGWNPFVDVHRVAVAPYFRTAGTSIKGIAGLAGRTIDEVIAETIGPLPWPFNKILGGITIPKTAYGSTSVVRMGANNGLNPWDSTCGGITLAHELGHNYGRFHIRDTCNVSAGILPPFDDLPYPNCTYTSTNLALPNTCLGFDSISGQVVVPNPPNRPPVGDLMSYRTSRWPSRETYLAMMRVIPNSGASLAAPRTSKNIAGNVIMVQGTLDPALRTASLMPCFVLPPGTYEPAKVLAMTTEAATFPLSHPVRIQLLNSAGSILLDSALLVSASGEGAEPTPQPFLQLLNAPAGTCRVKILANGNTLTERNFTAAAPIVSTPSVQIVGNSAHVAWTASDADGDMIFFTLQFHSSKYGDWRTIAPNMGDLSYSVDTSLLPGGNCRFRVIASDGGNTTTATSNYFALEKHRPTIFLSGLTAGDTVAYGSFRAATATANDTEDGALAATAIQWTLVDALRGIAVSGAGQDIGLGTLAPGAWTLHVTATDSDQDVTTVSTNFFVSGPSIPDHAEAPVLDGLCSDPAWDNAAVTTVHWESEGQMQQAKMRLVRVGGRLYGCATELADSPTAHLRISVDADTTGNGGDFVLDLFIDGHSVQYNGNLPNEVLDTTPDGNVRTMVLSDAGKWSAEFCLPESVLGGWNHESGFAWEMITAAGLAAPSQGAWPQGLTADTPPSRFSSIGLGVQVVTPNVAPVAVVEPDKTLQVKAGDLISLSAQGSYDPDDAITQWEWNQVSGPSLTVSANTGDQLTLVAPALTNSTAYRFRIKISAGGLTSAAFVNLTLSPIADQPLVRTCLEPLNVTPDGARLCLPWSGRSGSNEQPLSLQSSTDLTDWEDLAFVQADFLGNVISLDARPKPPGGKRFYRLRSGPSKNSLGFDGTDGVVTVPHSAALNAFPLTVQAWVKTSTNDAVNRGIVEKYIDGSHNGYLIYLKNGRLDAFYFSAYGGYVWAEMSTTPFIADGTWHHVAFTVDQTGASTYVDGILRTTTSWIGVAGPCTATTPLRFGKHYVLDSFIGEMDEVSIWNTALTQGEITAAMWNTLTTGAAGQVAAWHFDEGGGFLVPSDAGAAFTGNIAGKVQRMSSPVPR